MYAFVPPTMKDQVTRPTPRSRPVPATAITGVGQKSLRNHNLCLVFSQIAAADDADPLSRADLADLTGLTKATISSLVSTLLTLGLVTELAPANPHRAGRPAIPLAVAPGTVAALGLEINVDFLGLRAVDVAGNIVDESFERTNLRQSDPAAAFTALVGLAQQMIRRLADRRIRLIGACLALPGIADHPHGPLRLAPNLGWQDVDIHQLTSLAVEALADTGAKSGGTTDALRRMLVDHLSVDNEANLAARAEMGKRRDTSFVYVSGEIGIGAAIVVGGQVFTGLHGWAGEIGHVVVDPNGPTCACGAHGCLEMYAGKRSLMLNAGLDPDDNINVLREAYRCDNRQACDAINQAAEALGIALANCMNIVDVSQIVLGGSFAPLAEIMSQRLSAQITTRVLSSRWVGQDFSIRASATGDYAAATGSALAVIDQAVTDPASALWGA